MGANVNTVSSCADGAKTPLMLAAAAAGHERCVTMLLELGADVNKTDARGEAALIQAVRSHSGDTEEELLTRGADVNVQSKHSEERTPLAAAMSRRSDGIIEELLQRGADVNAGFEDTALMVAVRSCPPSVVKQLLDGGADVNAICPKHGYTALHTAAAAAAVKNFNILVNAGAVCDWSEQRISVLLAAVGCPLVETLQLKEFSSYWAGRTKVVKLEDRLDIVRAALRAGAQVNRRSATGWNSAESYIVRYSRCGNCPDSKVLRLLHAAGESLTRAKLRRFPPNVPKFVPPSDDTLKGLCREAIRHHLLKTDRHSNLFGRVSQLGFPTIINEYLLFHQTLQ